MTEPTTLSTQPPTRQVTSLDTEVIAFDFSQYVPAYTLSSPTAELLIYATGVSYPAGITTAPAVVGSTVTVGVGNLVAGTTYRLSVTVTIAVGNTRTYYLKLECLY